MRGKGILANLEGEKFEVDDFWTQLTMPGHHIHSDSTPSFQSHPGYPPVILFEYLPRFLPPRFP